MELDERRRLLDRFYADLDELESRLGGRRELADCTSRTGWPARGVYFFFEPGETRQDEARSRVVRVGTHGLRPSSSTLWGRLAQHKGRSSGAGSHRGSIFRLHVGTALLARGGWPDEVAESWSGKKAVSSEQRQAERDLEMAVSAYIGAMPFLWVEVPDPPSAQSDRGVIEAGAIALLSNLWRPPVDPASATWLGHDASRPSIRESGLWNVNHVQDAPRPDFLVVLERWIDALTS